MALPITSLVSCLTNAKDGDVYAFDLGAPLVLTKALPRLKANRTTWLFDPKQVIIMQLHVLAEPNKTYQRIKAMAAKGLSGDFTALSGAQKSAIDAALPTDFADVKAIGDAYLATLKPVTIRMRDAEKDGSLVRTASITYNGKTFTFGLSWGSGISGGIFEISQGVYGTEIRGGTWVNGRQEGSSYNGTGIRNTGIDHLIVGATFQDCEDGIRSSAATVANVNGEWFVQVMPSTWNGRVDKFGFHLNVDCVFDNCGSGGQAHDQYDAQSLINLAVRPKVIRTNGGNALKFHGGAINGVIDALILDATDTEGVLQCVDFDSGYCFVINSNVLKATAGTGNQSAVIMMRNERDPQPSWFENRIVVRGSIIGDTLMQGNLNGTSFVRAVDAPDYYGNGQGGGVWPGVPKAITGVVSDNALFAPQGAAVRKTPWHLPVGVVQKNNVLYDTPTAIIDPKLALPNYVWTRENLLANLADLITRIDGARPWFGDIFNSPLYPVGAVAPFVAADPSNGVAQNGGSQGGQITDPATPVDQPADPVTTDPAPVDTNISPPTPQPAPDEPPLSDQEKIMALENELAAQREASAALVSAANQAVADAQLKQADAERERDAALKTVGNQAAQIAKLEAKLATARKEEADVAKALEDEPSVDGQSGA
jgi:hypothetical protein